jgi:hypothetical protein
MRVRAPALLVSAGLALLAIGPSSTPARAQEGPSAGEIPDEILGDPPGSPALPRPGAAPETPVVYRGFASIQVNVDGQGANIPGDAANEPSLAVDPTAPNRLAIGWRQFDTVTSNFRQAGWGHSSDGGRTWTFPGVIEPGVFRSDPVLDYDASGVFYYSSLKEDFLVDVFRSFDQGESWSPRFPAFGGDKQWIAVDRTEGIGAGNIYEFWSPFGGCCGKNTFTRSTDGAQSFDTPIVITNNPRRGTLAVGPDGTLFATGVNPNNNSIFYVVRSADAQDPGTTPTFVLTVVNMGGSLVRPINNFSYPNPDGLLGQVWVAVDHSTGPTAGNVYVLCSVDPPGPDPLDVHVARSTDGGASFAPPIRVNDDPPVAGAWQWFATLAVSPDGRLDAVWNDTRANLVPNLSSLYYSFSTDGGMTWSKNEQMSPTWNSHVGFPNQNKIGDYYQLASDRVGAHLAWAATLHGEQDIYYLRIGDYDCNSNGVPDPTDIAGGQSMDQNGNGIPDECEEMTTAVGPGAPVGVASGVRLHQNHPNPFTPSTTIGFDVPPGENRARLRIFGTDGRLVRTLLDGSVEPGQQTLVWNARDDHGRRLASGVYYYRLELAGRSLTRAMVLTE